MSTFNHSTFVSGHAQQIFFFGFCSAGAALAAGAVICKRAGESERERERRREQEGEREETKGEKKKVEGDRVHHFFFSAGHSLSLSLSRSRATNSSSPFLPLSVPNTLFIRRLPSRAMSSDAVKAMKMAEQEMEYRVELFNK